jgi:hypothetical protein
MKRYSKEGEILSTVLDTIENPAILEFVTSNRYRKDLFSRFKKHLESKSEENLRVLTEVCYATGFNSSYVDLRIKPLIDLIFQINDQVNVTARKKLAQYGKIRKEDVNEQIRFLMNYKSGNLSQLFFKIGELYASQPKIFLPIYKHAANLAKFAKQFQEFSCAMLETKESSNTTPVTIFGILTPKPQKSDQSLDKLLSEFGY